MAGTLNKVMIIGNLGKDPEVHDTQSGAKIARLSVATSRKTKDQSGQYVDEVEWHTVILFNKTAEVAQRYLKKGNSAYFEGRLRTRKWQDKDGRDRWSTEVVADTLQLLGGRGDSNGGYQGGGAPTAAEFESQPRQRMAGNQPQQAQTQDYSQDDDVPF